MLLAKSFNSFGLKFFDAAARKGPRTILNIKADVNKKEETIIESI